MSVLLFTSTITTAQPVTDAQGDVVIGGIAVHPSAVLELISTTKGFLLPRMTEAQRDAIVSPAEALMIFNTTSGRFQYWDANTTSWETFLTSASLADYAWVLEGNNLNTAANPLLQDAWDGTDGAFLGTNSADNTVIATLQSQDIEFWTNNVRRAIISSAGNFYPATDNTYSLGTDANRWSDAYVNGGSVHVGPGGGEAAGTEMNLGYAGNIGTIDVDGVGADPEVTINAGTDVIGLSPDGDATAEVNVDAANDITTVNADGAGGAELTVNGAANIVAVDADGDGTNNVIVNGSAVNVDADDDGTLEVQITGTTADLDVILEVDADDDGTNNLVVNGTVVNVDADDDGNLEAQITGTTADLDVALEVDADDDGTNNLNVSAAGITMDGNDDGNNDVVVNNTTGNVTVGEGLDEEQFRVDGVPTPPPGIVGAYDAVIDGDLNVLGTLGLTGYTDQSVLFIDNGGQVTEDNPGFTYEPATSVLTVGDGSANQHVVVNGTADAVVGNTLAGNPTVWDIVNNGDQVTTGILKVGGSLWFDGTSATHQIQSSNPLLLNTTAGNIEIDAAGGQTTVDDNLVVTGTSDLQGAIFNTTGNNGGDVFINDNATVQSVLTVNGHTQLNSTMDVVGRSQFFNEIEQFGGQQVTFSGNVDANNGLDVSGQDLNVDPGVRINAPGDNHDFGTTGTNAQVMEVLGVPEFPGPPAQYELIVDGDAQVTGSFALPAFTQGSVIFAGPGGLLSQDNPEFFWDDANDALRLGGAAPAVGAGDQTLVINGTANAVIGNTLAGNPGVWDVVVRGDQVTTGILKVGGSLWFDGTSATHQVQSSNPLLVSTSGGNIEIDAAGGQTTVDDNLVVTGSSDLQGEIQNTTGNNGGDVYINDNATVSSDFNVQGNTDLDALLNVDGASTFNNTINQTGGGQVTFSGNVDAQSGLDVSGNDLTVDPAVRILAQGDNHEFGTTGVDAQVVSILGDPFNVGNYELFVDGDVQITGLLSLPGLAPNSVVYTDAGGNLATDNPPFSYNDVTNTVNTGNLTVEDNATLGDDPTADVHTINGQATFNETAAANAINIVESGAGVAIDINESDAGPGIRIQEGGAGDGITIIEGGVGNGITVNANAAGLGIEVNGGAIDGNANANELGDGTATTQLTIQGVQDATGAETLPNAAFDLAVIGDIGASGIIKSGASIVIDGVSNPRRVESDDILNINTTTGDINMNPAGGDVNVTGDVNASNDLTAGNDLVMTSIGGRFYNAAGTSILVDDDILIENAGDLIFDIVGSIIANNAGAVVVQDDLRVTGNTELQGDVDLGNAAGDAITLNGTLTGAGANHSLGTAAVDANVLSILGDPFNVGDYELFVDGDVQITGLLSLPALSGNSIVVTDAAGNLITDNPPLGYDATTDIMTAPDIVPSADNTYALGTDATRWADVYVNGTSVHIGPSGGEAGNTEMSLGYAAGSATINVNGGNNEWEMNAGSALFRWDPDGDGTLNMSLNPTRLSLNTGVGPDLFIAENQISVLSGANETLTFTNTGAGDLDINVIGDVDIDNNLNVDGTSTLVGTVDAQSNGNTIGDGTATTQLTIEGVQDATGAETLPNAAFDLAVVGDIGASGIVKSGAGVWMDGVSATHSLTADQPLDVNTIGANDLTLSTNSTTAVTINGTTQNTSFNNHNIGAVNAISGTSTFGHLNVNALPADVGRVNLGNPTGNVHANADILPRFDQTYDLGDDVTRWSQIFVNGNAGSGLHIGDAGGAPASEMFLTYAGGTGGLNINGGAPEVTITTANTTVNNALAGPGSGHSLGTAAVDANVLTINGDPNNVGQYELDVQGDVNIAGVLTLPGLSPNSVLYTNAAGVISTDNPPFTYNDATNTLGTDNLTVNDNATLGDNPAADAHTINGTTTVTQNGGGHAIAITETDAGDAININESGAQAGIDVTEADDGNGGAFTESGNGNGIAVTEGNAGDGVQVNESGIGSGLDITEADAGTGITVNESGTGDGITINEANGGNGLTVNAAGGGVGIGVNGTVDALVTDVLASENFDVSVDGDIGASGIIKSGAGVWMDGVSATHALGADQPLNVMTLGANDLTLSTNNTTAVTVDGTTQNVNIGNDLDVDGDLNADGNTTLDGTTIDGTLTQTGAGNQVTFAGNVDANNGLDVTGATSLAGTVTQTGGGQVSFSGNVDAANGVDVTGGNLNVTNNTNITGNLDVDGTTTLGDGTDATTINGPLTQNGAAQQVTFNGNVDAQNGLDVTGGNLNVVNNANVTGDLSVDGNATLGNNVADAVISNGVFTAINTANLNGNVNLGDAAADAITLNGTLTGAGNGHSLGTLASDATVLTINGLANTAPAYELVVNGDVQVTGELSLPGLTPNAVLFVDAAGDISTEATAGDFYWDETNNRLGIGNGGVAPTEALDVTGNIEATGTIQSGSSIIIDGTTPGSHNISTSGAEDLTIAPGGGDLIVTGNENVTGSLDVDTDLNVDGNTTHVGTLDQQGAISNSTGDVVVSDNLVVTGTSDLRGAVGSTVGDLNLADNVDVTGDLDVGAGNFTVAAATGNTDIGGTLDVTGAVTLDNYSGGGNQSLYVDNAGAVQASNATAAQNATGIYSGQVTIAAPNAGGTEAIANTNVVAGSIIVFTRVSGAGGQLSSHISAVNAGVGFTIQFSAPVTAGDQVNYTIVNP
ncbi:MAG: hypothetical protein R3F28_03965 [Candidatus Kapaibacterium sp.]